MQVRYKGKKKAMGCLEALGVTMGKSPGKRQ